MPIVMVTTGKREENPPRLRCTLQWVRRWKAQKKYVDCPSGEMKIYIIHGPGHSSNECKVLVDFGAKYAKGKPTKDRGNHSVPRNFLTGSRKIMSF